MSTARNTGAGMGVACVAGVALVAWMLSIPSASECPCADPIAPITTTTPDNVDPAALVVEVKGPTEAKPGYMVRLEAKTNAKGFSWGSDIEYQEFGNVVLFSTPIPGKYLFVLAGDDEDERKQVWHYVTIGTPAPVVTPPVVTPVDPTTRPTMATLVYEQRLHKLPPVVLAAISKANVARAGTGYVASTFDQDTTNGKTVPAQYKIALDAAKQAGLPCLVVQAGTTVLKVAKTESEMLEALK